MKAEVIAKDSKSAQGSYTLSLKKRSTNTVAIGKDINASRKLDEAADVELEKAAPLLTSILDSELDSCMMGK